MRTVLFGREGGCPSSTAHGALPDVQLFRAQEGFFCRRGACHSLEETRADATVRLVASPAVVQTIWSRCMCASLLAHGRKHPHTYLCGSGALVDLVRVCVLCARCDVVERSAADNDGPTTRAAKLEVLARQQMEEAVLQIIARVRNTNQGTDSRRSSRARSAPTLSGDEVGGQGNDANNANSCLQCCDCEHNDATEFAVEPFDIRMSFTKEDASGICLSVKMDEWARGSEAADEEVWTLRTNRTVSKYASRAGETALNFAAKSWSSRRRCSGSLSDRVASGRKLFKDNSLSSRNRSSTALAHQITVSSSADVVTTQEDLKSWRDRFRWGVKEDS